MRNQGGTRTGPLQDESFPQLDALAAAVAVVIGVFSVVGAEPGHHAEVAVLITVAAVPWVLRLRFRRWSYWWSVLVLGALAVLQLAGPAAGWLGPDASGQTSLSLLLWLTLDDAVGRPASASRATALVAAATILARAATDPIDATLIWLGGLLLCHLGGAVLRTVALTVVRLREAEGQLARDAVEADRRRVAREVHDVVAHSLSVTALHLSAARMANERGDPGATQEALVDAEALTRSSLNDLRRTIRLLRTADEDPGGIEAALPGLDELTAVVTSFRSAGMACTLTVPDEAPAVDELTGLALLRVTQEALTNACRHQVEPSATITLRAAGASLTLTVVTRGRRRGGTRPGTGLIGMTERVEALGGTLVAGAAPQGWRVQAEVPHPLGVEGPVTPVSGDRSATSSPAP